MKITNVKIRRVDSQTRLRAVVSITIEECFVVHEIRIIDGKNGLFVAMPSYKNNQGEFKDIAHPINTETRRMIEDVIISKYKTELEKNVA